MARAKTTNTQRKRQKTLRLERFLISTNKVAYRLRRLSGYLANHSIFTSKNSVLVVDSNGKEMLDQKVRQIVGLQVLAIFFNGRWAVGDSSAYNAADLIGNLFVVQFDRAIKWVGLSNMTRRLRENGGDKSSLIFSGNRRVSSSTIWQRDLVFFNDLIKD